MPKEEKRKPINWHRPLRPGDFRQRYLQNRWAHVPDDHLATPEEYEEYESYDYSWDVYEPGSPIDYTIHMTWAYLSDIHEPGQLKAAFEKLGWNELHDSDISREKELKQSPEEIRRIWSPGIEKCLAVYTKELMEGWFDPSRLPLFQDMEDRQIIIDLIEQVTLEKCAEYLDDVDYDEYYHRNTAQISPYFVCILFSPFWVRSPRTWVKPVGQDILLHFIRHLFEIYPTPTFIMSEWTTPFKAIRYKWLIIYILLAQGGNLKKAAPFFGWSIRKQFTKHFLEAPKGLSPVLAAIYAQIICLGGSSLEFDRIARNVAYIEDPTESSVAAEYKVFWESTIKWLIRNRNQVRDDEADLILEWAMHRFTEFVVYDHKFSLKGRTVQRTLVASRRYHEVRFSPWIEYAWAPHDWDWEYVDEWSKNWSFIELTSGVQLHEESSALHHCVESYAARCASKNSAIISVLCNKEKILTIEINPQEKMLVQVKGSYNRFPSAAENKIIEKWFVERISQ